MFFLLSKSMKTIACFLTAPSILNSGFNLIETLKKQTIKETNNKPYPYLEIKQSFLL